MRKIHEVLQLGSSSLYSTLGNITRRVQNTYSTRIYPILEAVGNTVDRLYFERLPWYFTQTRTYDIVNEPHRAMLKKMAIVGALSLGSFIGARGYEFTHSPEFLTITENLPSVAKFLAREVSGPLVGFLAGSSVGHITGVCMGIVPSVLLYGEPKYKKENHKE